MISTYNTVFTTPSFLSWALTASHRPGAGSGDTKMAVQRETGVKTDQSSYWRASGHGRNYAAMPHSAVQLCVETLI